MSYEKSAISNFGILLQTLSNEVRNHGNKALAMKVQEITNAFNKNLIDLRSNEIRDSLAGKGPIVTLKEKLGLPVTNIVNYFTMIPIEKRASIDDIYDLLKEFISTSHTLINEGGSLTIDTSLLRSIPENIAELKAGVYLVDNLLGKSRLCLSIQIPCGFLIVSLPSSSIEKITIRILTYIEAEGDWFDHSYMDVIDKSILRNQFLTVLKKVGCRIPEAIPYSMVLNLFNNDVRFTGIKLADNSCDIDFQNYIIESKWNESLSMHSTRLLRRRIDFNGNMKVEQTTWESLSSSKQNQLYHLLKDNINNYLIKNA